MRQLILETTVHSWARNIVYSFIICRPKAPAQCVFLSRSSSLNLSGLRGRTSRRDQSQVRQDTHPPLLLRVLHGLLPRHVRQAQVRLSVRRHDGLDPARRPVQPAGPVAGGTAWSAASRTQGLNPRGTAKPARQPPRTASSARHGSVACWAHESHRHMRPMQQAQWNGLRTATGAVRPSQGEAAQRRRGRVTPSPAPAPNRPSNRRCARCQWTGEPCRDSRQLFSSRRR